MRGSKYSLKLTQSQRSETIQERSLQCLQLASGVPVSCLQLGAVRGQIHFANPFSVPEQPTLCPRAHTHAVGGDLDEIGKNEDLSEYEVLSGANILSDQENRFKKLKSSSSSMPGFHLFLLRSCYYVSCANLIVGCS